MDDIASAYRDLARAASSKKIDECMRLVKKSAGKGNGNAIINLYDGFDFFKLSNYKHGPDYPVKCFFNDTTCSNEEFIMCKIDKGGVRRYYEGKFINPTIEVLLDYGFTLQLIDFRGIFSTYMRVNLCFDKYDKEYLK